MRLNVVNEYTYTLETIVQAGRDKIAMTSVPIRTNAELRPSRLFSSMFGYVKKSMLTIIRAFMMYKPLRFFTILGAIPLILGILLGIRFPGLSFSRSRRRTYSVLNPRQSLDHDWDSNSDCRPPGRCHCCQSKNTGGYPVSCEENGL